MYDSIGLPIAFLTALAGLAQPTTYAPTPSEPVASAASRASGAPEVFERVWEVLDRSYPFFDSKGIDWRALGKVYRPRIDEHTTDEELFEITMAMLGHLNDAHVCLDNGSRRECALQTEPAWAEGFSLGVVTAAYLGGKAEHELGGTLTYGKLSEELGYIHLRDCQDDHDDVGRAIDAALAGLEGVEGMVVDIRGHPGGADKVAQVFAGRFADRRRHFMTGFTRYGPGHGDFAPATYWNVEPAGPRQFTGPVIVITNRQTASAGDTLTLAMRVLPHVTVVGEMTEGALGSQYPESLPNGWTMLVTYKANLDPSGRCWDGIGIPPDLRVRNTAADVREGVDPALELAVSLLELGELEHQDESAGLATIRLSMATEFIERAARGDVPGAVEWLAAERASDDRTYFLSVDECFVLVQQLLGQGRVSECVALLEACIEEFPTIVAPYGMLATIHVQNGDAESARALISEAGDLEAWYSWETAFLRRAERSLGD